MRRRNRRRPSRNGREGGRGRSVRARGRDLRAAAGEVGQGREEGESSGFGSTGGRAGGILMRGERGRKRSVFFFFCSAGVRCFAFLPRLHFLACACAARIETTLTRRLPAPRAACCCCFSGLLGSICPPAGRRRRKTKTQRKRRLQGTISFSLFFSPFPFLSFSSIRSIQFTGYGAMDDVMGLRILAWFVVVCHGSSLRRWLRGKQP